MHLNAAAGNDMPPGPPPHSPTHTHTPVRKTCTTHRTCSFSAPPPPSLSLTRLHNNQRGRGLPTAVSLPAGDRKVFLGASSHSFYGPNVHVLRVWSFSPSVPSADWRSLNVFMKPDVMSAYQQLHHISCVNWGKVRVGTSCCSQFSVQPGHKHHI